MAHVITQAVLFQVLFLEVTVLTCGVALLFGHALWLHWHERRTQPMLSGARVALVAALTSHRAPRLANLPAIRHLPINLQVQVVADLAHSLNGEQRQWLVTLADDMGLRSFAETKCRGRAWWRRLQGARLLTLIGGSEETMRALLSDPHPLVRMQAIEWAADHPSLELISRLLDLLSTDRSLCRFAVPDALLRIGRPVVVPLARYLTEDHRGHLESALAVATGLAEPRLLAPALRLCRHESPGVRGGAANLLGATGGPEAVEALIGLLSDPEATVRANAARSLGNLEHWPAGRFLAPLLRDRAWIVRREAALALRAMGAPGILMLRRALSDADAFAADMARQVLDLPELPTAGAPPRKDATGSGRFAS